MCDSGWQHDNVNSTRADALTWLPLILLVTLSGALRTPATMA